jgi:hypothetical protein
MNMPPQAWRGIAALILAVGLAATVIILAIETIIHTGPVSTQEASLLSTVLGATVGAVAVYLGGHTPNGSGPVPSEEPAPPPVDPAPRSAVEQAGPDTA